MFIRDQVDKVIHELHNKCLYSFGKVENDISTSCPLKFIVMLCCDERFKEDGSGKLVSYSEFGSGGGGAYVRPTRARSQTDATRATRLYDERMRNYKRRRWVPHRTSERNVTFKNRQSKRSLKNKYKIHKRILFHIDIFII